MTYLGYNTLEFLFLRLDFDANLEHCKFCMDIFFFLFILLFFLFFEKELSME